MFINVCKTFEFLDVCAEAAEACASLDQMLNKVAAVVDDQSLDSLLALCNALSAHVATVSEAKKRFERAAQQARIDADTVRYFAIIFVAICSISDSNTGKN